MVNPPTAEIRPISVSEAPEDKFREFLEIRGEKLTDPRRVLVRHIYSTHKHFDADELVRDLHDSGRAISRSTVYRTLRLLVDAGLLRELRLTNRTAYEHDYGYPQHEHLVCENCGQMIEFQHPAIEAAINEICGQHQFQMSGHSFIIRGTCIDCNRARSAKRRLDLI